MRTIVKKYCAVALVCLVLLGGFGAYQVKATMTDVLTNGGFESGTEGWTLSSTTTMGTLAANNGNKYSGTNGLNYWNGSDFTLTVTQALSGLEDGVYSLSGYSLGDSGHPFPITLSVDTEDGQAYEADVINTSWNTWTHMTIDDIEVHRGVATVTIQVDGNAGAWGSFDEITLVKTGPLPDDEVMIVSAQPVTVAAIVNEVITLPAQVTVTYDTGDTGLADVIWEPLSQNTLVTPGALHTTGTVSGLAIVATADITYQYRSLDLNQDQTVDLLDLAEAAYRFGTTKQSSGWSAIADINNDGKVDLTDIQFIDSALQ